MKTFMIKLTRTRTPFLVLSILILGSLNSHLLAQDSGASIAGKTVDARNEKLDYVTVSLISLPDSVLTKASVADEKGEFHFTNIKQGKYFIKAELLGYKTTSSQDFVVSKTNKKVEVGTIQLLDANKELKAVTITAQKPLFERKADMMVVNVENSSLSAGNNALDILERSPGITIDKDDNINLNGKQGVMVMIDGKQTHLSASQLATLLRSTDGNTIQSLEIIDSPSAKYDAAGSSGIINIKLKKNRLAGTNGSFNLGGGYGNGHKANTSLNLNHKSGKINLFGTYSYQENDRNELININRIVQAENQFTSFIQKTTLNSLNKNHSLRTGIDYQSSEKNTISLQLSGLLNSSDGDNTSGTQIGSFQSSLDSSLIANSLINGNFKSYSINLNNTHLIDTLGRQISADVDFSTFYDKGTANYENYLYNQDGSPKHDPLLLRSTMPSNIYIQSYKTDYTHPLSEESGFEAGLKFANVRTDNNLKFNQFIQDEWVNMADRSNHFIYTEQVAAAYVNYHTKIKKFGIQAGLRSEYTISDGNSVTLDDHVKRDYFDYFPNIAVAYEASDNHQYSLSYTKRINRPQYDNLNPFNYFLDKYTFMQGNPYLQPEYNHSFKFNYTLLERFNFTTGYEITKNSIVEIMKQNDVDKTTFVTNDNISQQYQWYVNINAPVKFTKFWDSNTNFTGFYLASQSDELEVPMDYRQYAMQLNSNHDFQIIPTLSANATLNYQSSLRYSIYKIGSSWSTDVGVSKSFNNKRTTLKLSVSDIFNTRDQHVSTNYANLNTIVNQKRETQIFRLSFAYNFGNAKIGESKQKETSEEAQRVGK